MSRAVVVKYNYALLKNAVAAWRNQALYQRDLRKRYHTLLHRTNQQV